MSLRIERKLNDNDILYRFMSEGELDGLIQNKALLRFTKTEKQVNQQEGFAFGSQIQKEKNKSRIDEDEYTRKDIDRILSFIDAKKEDLQEELDAINEKSLKINDNECPGRKLIKKICKDLNIDSEKEILEKWDEAKYGIVLNIEDLGDKLDELPCRANIMHDSKIEEIENDCLNSSYLCCFWIKPHFPLLSITKWSLRENKVAAIKTTVGDLKKYLKKFNQEKFDENIDYYLCKVEYENSPKYMYSDKDFELPLEMGLYKSILPDKNTISEMLKNLKYKKKNFKREREMRIIAIRKDLTPVEGRNIFLPYDKDVCKEAIVSPRQTEYDKERILSKIRKLDPSLPIEKNFWDKIKGFFCTRR